MDVFPLRGERKWPTAKIPLPQMFIPHAGNCNLLVEIANKAVSPSLVGSEKIKSFSHPAAQERISPAWGATTALTTGQAFPSS